MRHMARLNQVEEVLSLGKGQVSTLSVSKVNLVLLVVHKEVEGVKGAE